MPPAITIGILTRDAGTLFQRVLDAVNAQEDSRERKIVVLDSGSTDGTPELAREAGARVEFINLNPFDFGVARERLFELAAGRIIVCLSQDAVPAHARWLSNLTAPLEAEAAASCGRSVPDAERAYRQFAWEANGFFYYTREMHRFRRQFGRGFSLANSAVRREAWEQFHFDPQVLGEDFQLQAKMTAAGMNIAFPGGAEVLHHHAYTLPSLRARCRNEGLAMRQLGFPYRAVDAAADALNPDVWARWAKDGVLGRLRTPAEWLFPIARPMAVYSGSRWGEALRPYRTDGRGGH